MRSFGHRKCGKGVPQEREIVSYSLECGRDVPCSLSLCIKLPFMSHRFCTRLDSWRLPAGSTQLPHTICYMPFLSICITWDSTFRLFKSQACADVDKSSAPGYDWGFKMSMPIQATSILMVMVIRALSLFSSPAQHPPHWLRRNAQSQA